MACFRRVFRVNDNKVLHSDMNRHDLPKGGHDDTDRTCTPSLYVDKHEVGRAASVASSTTTLGMFNEMLTSHGAAGEDVEEQREIADLVKTSVKDKGELLQIMKLLVVMAVPLAALVTLSAITLVQIFDEYQNIKAAEVAIKEFFQVDALVTSLQVERGISATYLSSDGTNQGALDRLAHLRMNTDWKVRDLSSWPAEFEYQGEVVPAIYDLMNVLNDIRVRVTKVELSFDKAVRLYTDINNELMDIAISKVSSRISDNLWSLVVAAAEMLRASDGIGIQRALGASYFTLCKFEGEFLTWFIKLDGELHVQKESAFIYQPQSRTDWSKLFHKNLSDELTAQSNIIYSSEYEPICRSLDDDERFHNSLVWFNNMTTYIVKWKATRTALVERLDAMLSSRSSIKTRDAIMYTVLITVLFIVFVVIVAMSTRYARNMKALTGKIARFAKQTIRKSVELNSKKKKVPTATLR